MAELKQNSCAADEQHNESAPRIHSTVAFSFPRTMGITEAQLQKQLREQLEIQRKLQLRIEELGKYFEMVEKTGKEQKASSPASDEPPFSPPARGQDSPPNDYQELADQVFMALSKL
ncbi:PREDICTED: protein PHOSPHATE STARVATION RESPONSE 1-like [Ipomoea nil]|uniref:protein PHOSPHATE STARVATION RESPONSE 1-like n=1 Tax=Ipomoea nil TaxID=35883 RepID=UPI000901617A|nr:PREDICTED: protein PHOSPHATE STARVATION RESPONSE 1-like [Ipomoea nil]